MPIYEYACQSCGKITDVLQKLTDPAPGKCPACGTEGQMTKMVSRSSFVLKGGGWYSDLYASTKKDGGSSTTPAAGAKTESSSSSTGTASTSTPAASSTSSSGSGWLRLGRRVELVVRRKLDALAPVVGRKFARGSRSDHHPRVHRHLKRRRRCVLCGIGERTPIDGHGRFLFIPDPDGRGPVCPVERGCDDRQRQLPLGFFAEG